MVYFLFLLFHSIDASISAEMTTQLFHIFSASLGVSLSTGYNWESASTETQSEATTITVEAEAPAGNYFSSKIFIFLMNIS